MAGCRESLTFTCNADYEQIFSHSNPQLPSVFFSSLCGLIILSLFPSFYMFTSFSYFSLLFLSTMFFLIFSWFMYFLLVVHLLLRLLLFSIFSCLFLVPHSLFSSSNSSPFLLSPPLSIHSYRFLLQPFFFKFCTTLPLFFPFLCYLSSLSSYIVFICSFSSTQQAVRCIWKAVSFYSEESGSHLNRWFMTEDFIKSWNQISACHVAP